MFDRKFAAVILLGLAALLSACQPAPNHNNRTLGRNLRSPGNPIGSNGQAARLNNSANASTQWAQLVNNSGDQFFDQQLYTFTLPMLDGADASQQLGYVSASPGQSTGVWFWGQAVINSTNGSSTYGTLDSSKAKIHVEIWDDKTLQGALPVVIHIGSDLNGFVSATGTVNGSSVQMTFTDGYGSVGLSGTYNSQYFSGTMYYSNGGGGQFTPIGTFQVATCGFFVCN
jgi:hypothetical protein